MSAVFLMGVGMGILGIFGGFSRVVWRLCGLFVVVVLVGCSTPQERAIRGHCAGLAVTQLPPEWVSQEVQRRVQVGERVSGYREKCVTTTRKPSGSQSRLGQGDRSVREGGSVQHKAAAQVVERVVEERVCRQEPLIEPVYELRWVTEQVDLNAAARSQIQAQCQAESLRSGLFADVR